MINSVTASPLGCAAAVALVTSLIAAPLGGCYTWRGVDDPVFEGGQIHAVAGNGQLLVAVGLAYEAYGTAPHYDAAAWTSTDAREWTRVPDNDLVFRRRGSSEIKDVVWTGSRFVAVGLDQSGGDADAAVWTSSDGLKWQRVPHRESVFGGRGDQLMVEVSSGSAGLVAIGQSARNASAWLSQDGVSWSAVPPNGVRGRPEGQGQLPSDIVTARPGVSLLAEVVGYDPANPGNCGQWSLTPTADGSLRLIPNVTGLGLCGPTMDWHRYPVRVAYLNGFTFAVLYRRASEALDERTVHTVIVSKPVGGWATVIEFHDPMFVDVFGDGEYDHAFAVVGSVGDLEETVAWIWRVGEEERSTLPRVLRGQERISSHASDVAEFKGVPVAVGYDFVGSIAAPQRTRALVWYRVRCLFGPWLVCHPD